MPTALKRPVLQAAAIYFAAVFFCGFVLGSIRIFLFLPFMEEIWAVCLELPVILTCCWLIAGRITLGRTALQSRAARGWMGLWAFALLMAAEFLLATTLMGLDHRGFFSRWATAAGAIGLAGQIVFALIPALRLKTENRPPLS